MNDFNMNYFKKNILNKAMSIAVLAMTANFAQAQTLPADAKPTCTVPPATFSTWFKTGVVTLNGEVNPANSVTFPDIPNCSFYQWSEQMFLWLTSPTPKSYGGGSGRIFNSPTFYDVSAPDINGDRTLTPHAANGFQVLNVRSSQVGPHNLPIMFDARGNQLEVIVSKIAESGRSQIINREGRVVEIERIATDQFGVTTFFDPNGKVINADLASNVAIRLKTGPKLRLLDTLDQKAILLSFKNGIKGPVIFVNQSANTIQIEQGQAGGASVLMAQNGSLVYYSTAVNDVFAYMVTGAKNGGISPAPTKFPTTQAELDVITNFAAAHGKTFPDPEALAIEVKSSWIETTGLDLSKYVVVNATVPIYDTSNPGHWVPIGTKNTKLAMIGMHVVGSTKGHPEMIWGTFEHFGVAPNAAYTYRNTSNVVTTVPQNTAGSWLVTASGASAPFNVERQFYSSPDILVNPPAISIGTSNTIRWKAFGAASNLAPNPLVSVADSNTQIIAINNSVISQLIPGDVRANYYQTGSTWTIGGASPNASNQVGTSKLANATMETYQQGTSNTSASGTNCFSCHSTNTTNVSHIYDALKALFP